MRPIRQRIDVGAPIAVDEAWAPLPGHDDAYEVSNYGRVRALDRILPDGRRWKGRLIRQHPRRTGHLTVNLTHPRGTRFVHVLVLEAFVGPCPEGMEALHWNDVAHDNRLENLRWGTRAENIADMIRNGGHWKTRITHCPRGHDLVVPNLVAYKWKKQGQRECLACSRARRALGARGKPFDASVADLNFENIMRSEVAA